MSHVLTYADTELSDIGSNICLSSEYKYIQASPVDLKRGNGSIIPCIDMLRIY